MKDSGYGEDNEIDSEEDDEAFDNFRINKKNQRRKKGDIPQDDKKFLKDDERKLLNRIRIYAKESAKLTISLRKIKVK